ncbi:MAG TPA: LiaF domain-containing protein [Ktedonobacterales bacterium]|nr:LiaF domain-containing protein [Ktedonobacterales bacterium]
MQQQQPQPPALSPQQEAIRQVRERYERGDLTFDRFEYALNALLQAQTPEECQAIVQELPSSPVSALDVMTAQPAMPAMSSTSGRTRWWVAFMGGFQRLSRPWKMTEQTIGIMVMGGAEVDLSLAALPRQSVIRLYILMGGAKLYVPRSVDVSVQSAILMGGVNALGESSGGIISFHHEESYAPRTPGGVVPQLEIQVIGAMGGVEVVQVDSPVVTGGGLRARVNQQIISAYDRAAERSIRHAEHEARRQLRHQQRNARYD